MFNSVFRIMLLFTLVSVFCTTGEAGVLDGPVVNPSNGHRYYLLSQANWTDSENEAISLGGHLVTVNDAQENQWVYSTFASYGENDLNVWIGFTDEVSEGVFVWSSGETPGYTKWYGPEPDDWGSVQDHAFIINDNYFTTAETYQPPYNRGWGDTGNTDTSGTLPMHGVVEVVPGEDQVVSDFDIDDDGWMIVDVASSMGHDPATSNERAPRYSATGGSPGGYIYGYDTELGWMSFKAPAKFLSYKLWAYAGKLSWQLKTDLSDETAYWSVALIGDEITLFSVSTHPQSAWSAMSVCLLPGMFRVNDPVTGAIANESQLRAVLSDLKGLYINGEWYTGGETSSLDTVRLSGPLRCDFNTDGIVNLSDLSYFAENWGEAPTVYPQTDVAPWPDPDGVIDLLDLGSLSAHWLSSICDN